MKDGAKRSRKKIFIAGAIILFMLLLAGAVQLFRELVGVVSEGDVESISEVPYVGLRLSQLKTFPTIHYAAKTAYRHNQVYISGQTSMDNIRSFCEFYKLRLYEYGMHEQDHSKRLQQNGVKNIQAFHTSFATQDTEGNGFVKGVGFVFLISGKAMVIFSWVYLTRNSTKQIMGEECLRYTLSNQEMRWDEKGMSKSDE